MAIELPASPKVYTHTYDNFKGVDYTNDATNVWHRRSPTGTNMLPDEAGTPFKRNGWEVLLSQDDIKYALGAYQYESVVVTEEEFDEDKTHYFTKSGDNYIQCTEEDSFDENETYYEIVYDSYMIEIYKVSYFELAGTDHIVVFTDHGVIFYNGDLANTIVTTENDCLASYDKCFFFEGNGTSAFYIYGSFRMWRYEYAQDDANAVNGFLFHEITDMARIPVVVAGSTGGGAGTVNESYNILTDLASIEYSDYDLLYYYGNDGCYFTVDEEAWKADTTDYVKSDPTTYWWKYDGSSWNWEADYTPDRGEPPFDSNIIKVIDPHIGDEIVVLYGAGMMLPVNIEPPLQIPYEETTATEDEFNSNKNRYFTKSGDDYIRCDNNSVYDANETYYIIVYKDVRVFVTMQEQFDTELEVQPNYRTLDAGNCCVVVDELNRSHPQAHIEFYAADTYKTSADFDGQDTIKVVFPTRVVSTTQATYSDTTTASLRRN